MKRTFTLLITFLFLASAGYAFQNRLTISSSSSNAVRVLIDGRTYQLDNNGNNRDISITNIRPGNRNIKIYVLRNAGRNWQGNNNSGQGMQLVYNSNLYIRDGADVDLSINRFGKVFVDEQQIGLANSNDNWNNSDDWNDNRDRDRNYNRPMDDRAFLQLRQTLASESFEDARLNMARTVLANKSVSTTQVKELMSQFNFENNKLDLAKYCYRLVTDRQNYYSLADGLAYSSSKKELVRFIQQQN